LGGGWGGDGARGEKKKRVIKNHTKINALKERECTTSFNYHLISCPQIPFTLS